MKKARRGCAGSAYFRRSWRATASPIHPFPPLSKHPLQLLLAASSYPREEHPPRVRIELAATQSAAEAPRRRGSRRSWIAIRRHSTDRWSLPWYCCELSFLSFPSWYTRVLCLPKYITQHDVHEMSLNQITAMKGAFSSIFRFCE